MRRRTALAGLAATAASRKAWAQGALPTIRIGVLWDRSGPGASLSGPDQPAAARLAVEDHGRLSRGYPIEVLDEEFERRPDRALAFATEWFDRDKVAAIVGVPGTTAAVLVQDLARARDRTVMNTSSLHTALTAASCSPTASHWMEDTRALTAAMTAGMADGGIRTWFLVVPDDTTGLGLQAGATAAIQARGGTVVGFARHPADATSFTSAMTHAAEARADAVGLCGLGLVLATQIREARAAGLFAHAVCAYAATIRDIHAMGREVAEGLYAVSAFYWNQNERARAFATRFFKETGRMPDKPEAATHAAVSHFLRMVEVSDTVGGAVLNAGLRRDPPYFFGAAARIRDDGRLTMEAGLYQVKPSSADAAPWDHYRLVRTIPAPVVFPIPQRGTCPAQG